MITKNHTSYLRAQLSIAGDLRSMPAMVRVALLAWRVKRRERADAKYVRFHQGLLAFVLCMEGHRNNSRNR